MIKPPVIGTGPTRINLQFRTFVISSVAVNKPVNTGKKAKDVFFEDARTTEFATISSLRTFSPWAAMAGASAVRKLGNAKALLSDDRSS
jgi:hypothetical protein